MQEHGVAEGEEAITLVDGVLVGGQDVLAGAEGGDEHHERGARHVEVGDQGIHHVELIARQDVEARGLALPGTQGASAAVGRRIPGALQTANARRAHGDNAAARGVGRVHGVHCGGGHRVELGVDDVLLVPADKL